MTLEQHPKPTWYECVINDDGLLSGASVSRFIRVILSETNIDTVLSIDLEGGFSKTSFKSDPMEPKSFLAAVENAVQFDWAFFIFFKSPSNVDSNGFNLRLLIEMAGLAIRLVDNQYIYLYTDDVVLKELLKSEYPGVTINIVDIKNVVFPY